MGLLDPSVLGTEVAIEDALSVPGSDLEKPPDATEDVLNALISSPHLELAVSGLDDPTFHVLEAWLMENFPSTASDYASSISCSILSRLSLSLLFVSFPFSEDEQTTLKEYRHAVEQAPGVFALLCSDVFDDADAPEPAADFFDIPIKRKTQRERKKRKRRSTVVDRKPFDAFGIDTPSGRTQADGQAVMILKIAKGILQVLRRPNMKEAFQLTYLPAETSACADDSAGSCDSAELTPPLEPDVEVIPSAYPMVQPMRAALYFDSADGFGEWRVLISTRADADLRQARKREFKLFEIIIKKIKELSMGHFSDDNQKRLTGPKTDIPIYEAKMTGDSRLIYQIDCVAEFESHVERQVIKIFGIYTHAQLDKRFWSSVGHQLARKGKEYHARCIHRKRPQVVGDKVYLPESWPALAEEDSAWTSAIPDLHKDDLAKMHELLVLEKYVTFSQALLNSVLADKDVQHVFDISTHEMRIIEHPGSCYVIGRSGTGKTTTMMFKMLGIERSAQSCSDTLPKPRQLFVTQSRILAEKVEQFFTKLMAALTTSNLSAEELEQMKVIGRMKAEQGMVDLDEEIAHRGDLPKRFSELTDDHFPMFATFDQLCSLYEADFNTRNTKQLDAKLDLSNTNDLANDGPLRSTDYMQQSRAAFVSYGVFLEQYWSHFPQSLTKDLDPTLVFGEFMGVIKGSEQTLDHVTGYLDRETYINFSYRQQATFVGKRETIYSLFEIYSKRKRERGEYDAADRTHAILKRLSNGDLPGKQVDFIYIDEAQDNLLVDALILRTMCKNPTSGLFWAGDTAQTISVGSAFRFNDLKAFLYRIETNGLPEYASRVPHPESFQLAVNYRSHAGIVNCAHSIIELITEFWPNAIDALAQEKGMIDGLKPVFFSGWDEDTVRYEQFLFGESGNQIEFGAEQCILVRDDAARERLRAQVGDIGIIMTLYESKGLEFNDVLLYNFFEDSAVDVSQWRVVLNALTEDVGVKTPRFDEVRHSSVCRELKFLYVACTRARMNLWIADGSAKAEPMRLFWTARNLVDNCTPGTDVPRLAASSTPEQWAATGRALFDRRRYTQAMHCYERASLPREKAVAHAYWLREQARGSPVQSHQGGPSRSKAFATAADAFWKSADEALTEKHTYFRISAECYVSSGDDVKAAKAYYRAREFDLAAQLYRKVGMFDEAVAVIKSHRDAMDENVTNNIMDVSKLFYVRDRKLKQARDLFETDEEALEYMEDYGFDLTRASYLEEMGRFAEAADIHLSEGRTLEAIALLSRDTQDASSIFRASQCLLDGLWAHLSFGIMPNQEPESRSDTLRDLLRLLSALDIQKLDGRAHDEVLMFRAIISADFKALSQLGERLYREHQDVAAALVCLDHVCTNLPSLRLAPAPEVTRILKSFLLYARILQNLSADTNACSNDIMRRLFRFEHTTEEFFLIPEGSWLYIHCGDSFRSRRLTDRGTEILRWDLETLIHRLLRGRLRQQVRNENHICRDIQLLQPCLLFVVLNRCPRRNCPRAHTNGASLNQQAYHLRVRISIQQILIYHTIFAVEDYQEQVIQRRHWIRQFYEALYPAFYTLGSQHNIAEGTIPELQDGIQVLNAWTREQLVSLKPDTYSTKAFLTILIRTASLSFDFDVDFAHHDIKSIRAVCAYNPEYLLRGKDKDYIVHDVIAFMEDSHSYSLSSGVLFVRHILENRLHIDITVFCDILDRLCGMLIMANRNYQQKTPTLHDITLPRSWLMRLARDFEKLPNRDSNLIFLYIRPMADLLEQMYNCDSNADHLLFASKDLAQLGWDYGSVFIHRVCRNLCLLGYNIRNDRLRHSIYKAITSIRKPDRRYNALFSEYVHAKEWDDLSRVVRRSTAGSSLDEMIQLHDAKKTHRSSNTVPYVRRVVYKTLDEIPILLGSTASALPAPGPASETAPTLPVRAPVEETRSVPSMQDDRVVDERLPEQEPTEEPREDAIQDIDGVAPVTIEKPLARSAESTQEELRAARIILTAYRKYIRRRGFVMSLARGMRMRLHAACYSASRDIEWSRKSLHKKLFLGAVPHLLVCLEYTREHLHAAKAQARKRVMLVEHSELEKVNAEINDLTALFKKAIQLEKILGPQSELHKRRDVGELRAYTQQVKDLVHTLPLGAALGQEDLGLAMHAIIEAKAVPAAKTPKPELNVEDEDSLLD